MNKLMIIIAVLVAWVSGFGFGMDVDRPPAPIIVYNPVREDMSQEKEEGYRSQVRHLTKAAEHNAEQLNLAYKRYTELMWRIFKIQFEQQTGKTIVMD